MEDWNIIEVLKVGLPGLVFLLSMLAFRLLSTEQKKEPPRPMMLKAIRNFMLINVVLAIMTLASPIIDGIDTDAEDDTPLVGGVFDVVVKSGISQLKKGNAAVCHSVDYANRYLLVKNKENSHIIQVFASTIIPCSQEEHILLHAEDLAKLGAVASNESSKVEVVVALPGYKFTI